MANKIDLKSYVDIVGESSKRTRTALLFTTIISTYWGFGFWNDTQERDPQAGIEIQQLALDCFDQYHSQRAGVVASKDSTSPKQAAEIKENMKNPACEISEIDHFFKNSIGIFPDKKSLADHVTALRQKARRNDLTLRLPFGVLFISVEDRWDWIWKYLPVSLFYLPVIVQGTSVVFAFAELGGDHGAPGWYSVNIVLLIGIRVWLFLIHP